MLTPFVGLKRFTKIHETLETSRYLKFLSTNRKLRHFQMLPNIEQSGEQDYECS